GPGPASVYTPRLRALVRFVTLGDLYQGGTQEPIVEGVALAEDLDHGPLFEAGHRLVEQGLVLVGIEGLSGRVVGDDAMGLEQAAQSAVGELHALFQRGFLARRLERALEVVEARDQIAEEGGHRFLAGLLAVALGAAAEVLEVRASAEELVAQFVALLPQRGEG